MSPPTKINETHRKQTYKNKKRDDIEWKGQWMIRNKDRRDITCHHYPTTTTTSLINYSVYISLRVWSLFVPFVCVCVFSQRVSLSTATITTPTTEMTPPIQKLGNLYRTSISICSASTPNHASNKLIIIVGSFLVFSSFMNSSYNP